MERYFEKTKIEYDFGNTLVECRVTTQLNCDLNDKSEQHCKMTRLYSILYDSWIAFRLHLGIRLDLMSGNY